MLLRLHDKSMIMGGAALPRHQTGLRGMMMAAMMYAAAAHQAEQRPDQTHHGGVDAEVFGDPAADTVDHFVLIGFIQLLFHNGCPHFFLFRVACNAAVICGMIVP